MLKSTRKPRNHSSIFIAAIIFSILLLGCGSGLKYKREGALHIPWHSGWLLPRYDGYNTGFVDRELKLPLELKWEYKTSAAVTANCIGNEYFIVAGDLTGNLYMINTANGKKMSKESMKGVITAPPLLKDSLLFFSTNTKNDRFGAINIKSGEILWENEGMDFSTIFSVGRGALYIGGGNGRIGAWRVANGSEVWSKIGNMQTSGGCITRDTIVFAAFSNGNVTAYNSLTGEKLWQRKLGAAQSGHITITDSLVICAGLDSTVHLLDTESGSEIWDYQVDGVIRGGVSIAGNLCYFGCNSGKLFAIDIENHSELFYFQTDDPITTSVLITKNKVAFGSLDGRLYILNRFTGELLFQYETEDQIISSPILAGNGIAFSCHNKKLLYLYPH
ncbi:MAG: PQQ-binding-like beta-propeller repeat protein [candidate division Zixibacteria bacterium]|nr:PQQ-binding-like beta-propeller repeat protein [candidate division Zixibacteria bacterium]